MIAAANEKADLIIFPEASLTGFELSDHPEKDLHLGVEIPGQEVDIICSTAKSLDINVALGLFEKADNKLFDSAIFINREGLICENYHRISATWHSQKTSNETYMEGNYIKTFDSDCGKLCFLICGDLFDEGLVEKVQALNPDLLLYPYARSWENNEITDQIWEESELPYYQKQIAKISATTLACNSLNKLFFGGAAVFSSQGEILAKWPINKEGILYWESK